jgi:protein gp37
MGDKTGIEWTDATWNPVRGCSRVSPGCENCYAESIAGRFCDPGQPYHGLAKRTHQGKRWTGEVRLVPEHLADPLRWKKPRRVFVNSMSDLFHEKLSNEEIAAVFGVMAATPQHTHQVLTKRPKRMLEWFRWAGHDFALQQRGIASAPNVARAMLDAAAEYLGTKNDALNIAWRRFTEVDPWPIPNVWLGVSVEDQRRADERIPLLLQTPAAVRFVSAEPLLGPVDLAPWIELKRWDSTGRELPRRGIDWVIAGAESGPGARPMDEACVRSLRDQCAAAGVPLFYKQRLDERGHKVSLPVLDGRQYAEWPDVGHA